MPLPALFKCTAPATGPAPRVKAAIPLVPIAVLKDDELTCDDLAKKQRIRDAVFPTLKDDMTYVAVGIKPVGKMYTITLFKGGAMLDQATISQSDKCYAAAKDVIDSLPKVR